MPSSAGLAFRTATTIVLPAAFALPAGCASPRSPVGVATVAVNPASVLLGASVEVTIQFDVAPTLEPLHEDYRVFLHAFDEHQGFLWADEHYPPVPTSAWRPGQSIRYTQSLTVPLYPYIGPAVIAIGLRSPISGERLSLVGNDLGEFVYQVATLTLELRHESFLLYAEGWHQVESDALHGTNWRWTTGRAVLSFRNPHEAIRLRLDVQGRPDLFDRPQRLLLVIGERTLGEARLDTNDPVHLDYKLTAAELGGDDVVRLELLVDQTFVPVERGRGPEDARELGVRVFDASVEPLSALRG